jgi:diguanylate cyclase (GGDEF)-like protein
LDSEKLGEAAIDLGMRRLLLNRAASEGIFAQDCTEQGFLTNFSAVLGMPLFHETTLGGVVVLFRVSGRYSPGLLELMNRFSHRAAAALKNVLIEQENEAAVEENARLYLDLSKLYRRATVDNLTGMYNRAHMTQRLNEEIKKSWRFKQPLTLVAVNLDNFRQINQQYGTKTGDEVLRIISRVMRKTARDYDIICRHGGDDFAIILPQTSTEGAVALAERLRREVAITIFPSAIHIALSMGVAGFTATTSDRTQINEECVNQAVKSLCELTEEALELAKNAGGDRVETLGEFDPAKIAGLE